jgi:hypothetical protein
MRQKILTTLLIGAFGAMAATAGAQSTNTAPNNSPRNAPVGSTVAPSTDGSADPSVGARTPSTNSGMNTPMNSQMNGSMPTSMTGYKSARSACEKQPVASQEQCRIAINTRYSGVAPKCQKLLGSALDECLKGADTGQ